MTTTFNPTTTNLTNTNLSTTVPTTGTGKGNIIFRPLEAKFNADNNYILKMNPYCKLKLGWHTAKTAVAIREGTSPHWNDAIVLKRKHGEEFAKLKIKDRDTLSRDDNLGTTKIPLDEVIRMGKTSKWFNLYKDNKITGEVLITMEYTEQDLM